MSETEACICGDFGVTRPGCPVHRTERELTPFEQYKAEYDSLQARINEISQPLRDTQGKLKDALLEVQKTCEHTEKKRHLKCHGNNYFWTCKYCGKMGATD